MQAKQRFTNVTLVTPFGEINQDLLVEDELIAVSYTHLTLPTSVTV